MSKKWEFEVEERAERDPEFKLDLTIARKYIQEHGKPTTRREFLASGVAKFSGAMMMPTVLNVMSNAGVAKAQDLNCSSGAADMPALITVSLSGGAGLSGNFVVTDQGGNLLPSYDRIGLGAPGQLAIDNSDYGGAPFAAISQFLAGTRVTSTAPTRANTAMIGLCCQSQDDSSINKFDITGMAAKHGLEGKLLKNLGTRQTDTGNRHQYAFVQPPSPLIVNSYNDIVNALGVAGSLNSLNASQLSKVFKLSEDLTFHQAAKLAGYSGGTNLAELIKCAVNTNSSLISESDGATDPLNNAAFAAIWNINANTNPNSREYSFGSMVYNALLGNCGSVNLELGGYDYHGNARANTDQRDLDAGQLVGQILESFAVMGKPGAVYVCSDGAVGSVQSDTAGSQFTSDRGQGGMSYFFAYHPNGAPTKTGHQVGWFTAGQGAAREAVSGGSPERMAASVYANYLSLAGRTNLMDSRILSNQDMAQAIKIFPPS